MNGIRQTWADVSIPHLKFNYRLLKGLAESVPFIPVIKANAYGHGDYPVAQALVEEGASVLAVCTVEEGLTLRAQGLKSRLMVMGPFTEDYFDAAQVRFPSSGIAALVANHLEPCISSLESLKQLAASGIRMGIHLKFNTGMNRLGMSLDEGLKVKGLLAENPQLKVLSLMSHLIKGDDFYDLPNSFSQQQLQKFLALNFNYFQLPKEKLHVLNSDGLLSATLSQEKLQGEAEGSQKASSYLKLSAQSLPVGARVGIGLYGYTNVKHSLAQKLKPVMSLKTKIAQIHNIRAGDVVSYSGRFCADRPSTIAVLPIGYADGYPRILTNQSEVSIAGFRAKVVGTICMDYLMVDVSDLVGRCFLAPGVEVELFGESIELTDLAAKAQTITYEMLTSISYRVPKRYLVNPLSGEEKTMDFSPDSNASNRKASGVIRPKADDQGGGPL